MKTPYEEAFEKYERAVEDMVLASKKSLRAQKFFTVILCISAIFQTTIFILRLVCE